MDPETTMSWNSALGITLAVLAVGLSMIGLISLLASGLSQKQQDDSGSGWLVLPALVILFGISSVVLINS